MHGLESVTQEQIVCCSRYGGACIRAAEQQRVVGLSLNSHLRLLHLLITLSIDDVATHHAIGNKLFSSALEPQKD
jgi:hypothetical protein